MDVYPIELRAECTVVAVRGDLDLYTADRLLAALHGFLRPGGPDIGLDLSQVTFMDCAGLRPLIALGRSALGAGVGVHLVTVSPAVARLLELIDPPEGAGYLSALFYPCRDRRFAS